VGEGWQGDPENHAISEDYLLWEGFVFFGDFEEVELCGEVDCLMWIGIKI
jgi:hypothetical protein